MSLVLWLLSGTPALAVFPDPEITPEDEARARAFFEEGRSLYTEGRYDEAIVQWNACYDITRHADLLYNISNAQEKLGNYQEAVDSLKQYQIFADAEERDTITRKIEVLEGRLKPKPAPDPAVVVAPADPPDPLPKDPPGRAVPRWLPAAGLAVGGAGLVTGAGLGIGSLNARSTAQESCASTDLGLVCKGSADPTIQRYRGLGTGAVLGLTVGAALTGSSVYLLMSDSGSPTGLGLTGSF